jgi:glycosyltransferase involved in cell wall biosynthesis
VNIVLTTTSFLPRVGGKELALHHLAEALGGRGHDVTVQCRALPDTQAPMGTRYSVVRYGPRTWGGGRSKVGEAIALGQLAVHKATAGLDVLNAHGAVACGLHTVAAQRLLGAPLVVTVHGGDVQPAGGADQRAVGATLRAADRVVAKSPSMLAAALELGVAPERIECIANGIAPAAVIEPDGRDRVRRYHSLPADAVIAVSVGRNYPVKGFPTAVEALALARQTAPDLHYVHVGRDADALREQARRLGVEDAVHLLGELPHREVLRLLAAADLFVNSSLSEGSPNATLEALAAGLPCVITEAPGNRDVEAPGALFPVPVSDAGALAGELIRLCGDHELRLTAGRAARDAVSGCGWGSVAASYEQAYAAAARAAATRRRRAR